MIITTLQPQEVFNICRKETFYTDITKSEYYLDPLFMPAYDWLVEVMKTRIEKPPKAEYPVWGWYKYNNKNKLDLRNFTKSHPKNYYSITLNVPDNQVLLSDYDSWHGVLNNWCMHDYFSESNYEKNEKYYDDLEKKNIKLFNKIKIQNWYNIFILKPNIFSKCFFIQATFWKIEPDWIISAKQFGSL